MLVISKTLIITLSLFVINNTLTGIEEVEVMLIIEC